jgi:FtsZ-binding cell division protein ZapB
MIKIPKLTAPKVVSEESDIVKLMKSGLTSLESPELRKILEDVYGITALRKELDGLKEENEKLSSGAESAKETTEEQTKATEKQTDITKIFGDLINQHTDLLKANGIPTTEEQTKATTKQTEQTTVYAQLQKAYTDYMNGTGIPAIQSQINVSQLLSSTLDGVGLTFSQTAETAKAATKAIQDYNAMAADYDKRWGTGAFATYKATGQTVGNTGGYSYTDVTGKTVATAKNTFYDPNTKSNFTVNPEYATLYSDQMIFQEGMNHPAVTTGNIDILTGWGKTGYAVNDIVPVQTGGELQALQGGGIVSKAGLFNLHAGEAVVPAGDNYSYGGITISINNPVVRSEADIDDLAKKVGEKIKDAISRRVRLV